MVNSGGNQIIGTQRGEERRGEERREVFFVQSVLHHTHTHNTKFN
jgi:hypothetical protein